MGSVISSRVGCEGVQHRFSFSVHCLSISVMAGGIDGSSVVFLFTKKSEIDFIDGKGLEHDGC